MCNTFEDFHVSNVKSYLENHFKNQIQMRNIYHTFLKKNCLKITLTRIVNGSEQKCAPDACTNCTEVKNKK